LYFSKVEAGRFHLDQNFASSWLWLLDRDEPQAVKSLQTVQFDCFHIIFCGERVSPELPGNTLVVSKTCLAVTAGPDPWAGSDPWQCLSRSRTRETRFSERLRPRVEGVPI